MAEVYQQGAASTPESQNLPARVAQIKRHGVIGMKSLHICDGTAGCFF
jgi:hypothetical protein